MVKPLSSLNILCYRWGDRYGVEYVNKLHSMVRRHLPVDHIFHCVTDNKAGLNPGIEAHELPDIGVAGNWNKLQTFREDFLGLQDQYIVCMDIDLVIVDSLEFLTESPEFSFMIAKNWAKGMRGNSSVYRLKVGSHTEVWKDFIANPERVIDNFHGKDRLGGDQRWMNHRIKDYNYFQDGRVISFKRHCWAKSLSIQLPFIGQLSTAPVGKAIAPQGASVIAFTGKPLPPDVCDSHCGRWRHAPFVAEHWC